MFDYNIKGMRDPGEVITKTLSREFAEEALSHNVKYDKRNRIDVTAGALEQQLNNFFKNGLLVIDPTTGSI